MEFDYGIFIVYPVTKGYALRLVYMQNGKQIDEENWHFSQSKENANWNANRMAEDLDHPSIIVEIGAN